MTFARNLLPRFAWLLFLSAVSGPASSAELLTSYRLDGVTYPSLPAAEKVLFADPDITGSSHFEYQYTWWYEGLRRYSFPPTTDFVEGSKLVFYFGGCDACPVHDQWGNDLCTLWDNLPYLKDNLCNSYGSWLNSIIPNYTGGTCQFSIVNETPWHMDSVNAPSSFPYVLPDEILPLAIVYSKVLTANLSNCSNPRQVAINVNTTAEGTCPPGYTNVQGLGGGLWQCYNWRYRDIGVDGAKVAETNSNSCADGNPCHPTTGDKTATEADFIADGLSLTRYYHSHQIYRDYASMGRGWSHNYSGRIIVEDNITKMIDGKGNAERFTCVDTPACTIYRSQSESGHTLRPVTGGWEVYLNTGELRHYDSSGKLVLITDRSPQYRQLAITYTAGDRVSEVIDQTGRALEFSYNTHGLVETVTLPDGQQIQYQYATTPGNTTNNPKYNLVKVIRQDLSERNYHYEDVDGQGAPRYGNLLTGITDENGVRFATYTYDDAARVTSSEHAGGAGHIDLNYTKRPGENVNWSITEVTTPLGEVKTYDVEAGVFRKPTGINDSRGSVTMTYDPASYWLSSRTDREGNLTTYQFNGLHVAQKTEAAGTADERVIETDWNNGLNRVTERREPGKTANFVYNARGQMLSRTETDTATLATRKWIYTYFEIPSPGPLIGQIKTLNGPRTDISDVTTYDYYTSDDPGGTYVIGDLKSMTNSHGHRTDYLEYDANGRLLQLQDPNGVVISMTYHPRGWISSRTKDGKTTSFAYDDVGNLTRITQPDGSFIAYEYDLAHRMNAIEDNFGNRIEYTLDAAGNRVVEKTYDNGAAPHRQLTRMYDQLNRLQSLIDGNNDVTGYGYDNNGNRSATLDADSNTTSFEYDALDRLIKTVDANLGETDMAYDARDNLISVTYPLNDVTQYTYDGLDNQTELDSPDTGVTTYEYDDAGNRTAATDARNVRVEYAYDALNRLTGVSYPDSSLDVSFTYDTGAYGKGRLTQMADAVGTVDYSYDARGKLTSETRTIGVDQYVTSYAYNGADRLTQITYPSGMLIGYSLDAAGRITAVDKTVDSVTEPLVSNIQYEPFGPVASFTYGNGLTYSATYDQDYELDQLQAGSGLDWVLGHDPVGNILSIDDQIDNSLDQTLTYDALYRLDSALGGYGSEDFDYDANGNRTHYQNGIVDDAYTYELQSNRLATQDGWTFSRDATGNRTEKLDGFGYGQLYVFGDHNRLRQTSVRDVSGDTVVGDYQYDGRGQRSIKTTTEGTTHFIYGPSGELLGEYAGDGETWREYIYLNGQPIALYAEAPAAPPTPLEIIMDNDDPETSYTGKFKLTSNPQAYNGDYELADKDSTYRWTPTTISGTFEVYAWWVEKIKHSRAATYTIVHKGTADVELRGHDANGGQWNLLGTYEFAGGAEYVELSSGDRKKIAADAIRFTEVPSGGGATGGTYFIHTDQLGTPRQVSDDQQTIVWRWDSAPFGDSAADEDPDGDLTKFTLNLRFPGQYFDAESGLYYNYFRTYDPTIGRYIESDPVGLNGGLNIFGYVNGSPMGYSDPLGLCKVEASCNLLSAGPILGSNVSHCFIVVTEPGGGSSYFRGGPSSSGGTLLDASSHSNSGIGVSGDSGFGNIVNNSGAFVPGTIDWPTDSTPSTGATTYIDNDKPCGCIENELNRALQNIQNANIPYNPLSTNSNSVAFRALQGIGVNPGVAPAPAPGWGIPLPVSSGSDSAGQCCDQ